MGIKKEDESVWYETLVIVVGVIIIALVKSCLA
jgi:hypothetical protein